jgi:hypothetical protein
LCIFFRLAAAVAICILCIEPCHAMMANCNIGQHCRSFENRSTQHLADENHENVEVYYVYNHSQDVPSGHACCLQIQQPSTNTEMRKGVGCGAGPAAASAAASAKVTGCLFCVAFVPLIASLRQ